MLTSVSVPLYYLILLNVLFDTERKLCLYLMKDHFMNTYWSGGIVSCIHISTPGGCEWLA